MAVITTTPGSVGVGSGSGCGSGLGLGWGVGEDVGGLDEIWLVWEEGSGTADVDGPLDGEGEGGDDGDGDGDRDEDADPSLWLGRAEDDGLNEMDDEGGRSDEGENEGDGEELSGAELGTTVPDSDTDGISLVGSTLLGPGTVTLLDGPMSLDES